MKGNVIFFMISLFLLHVWQNDVRTHGFAGNTLIHLADNNDVPIKKVCKQVLREKVSIFSTNLNNSQCTSRLIKSVGRSISDLVISLQFDHDHTDVILCSPQQAFYVPYIESWVRACNLKLGDQLITKYGEPCSLTKIEVIKAQTKVYSIAVDVDHTFFVGKQNVLTHNMFCRR